MMDERELEFVLFCEEHESDDIRELGLKANKYSNIDIKKAIKQIQGLKTAKYKLPSWYANKHIIYPIHLSLEQASSESTALYKQSLLDNKKGLMVDLTGGLGVDISFLSKSFNKAIYVEQQSELANLATLNFKTLGLSNIEIVNEDAIAYLNKIVDPVDLIYIDPARRDDLGKKVLMIEDCTPNLIDISNKLIEKAKSIMIKLSPMLDISSALVKLNYISELHIISVNNECKELLFIKRENDSKQQTKRFCININREKIDSFEFSIEDEKNAVAHYTSVVKMYLYEPNASIMKAGAYKSIAEKFNLEKLHPNSHLYTSDRLDNSFPGRVFSVETISSFEKKDLKEHLSKFKQANISIRNFPQSVDTLRKKLKLKDGGDSYIFATTLNDNKKFLIFCRKI